jgi:arsenite methyltransferase
MSNFWDYTFEDTAEFIDTFDELPLWSAAFGLLLLKHLNIRTNVRLLDLGSGAGFPLLELAERMGKSSTCYGLDPWANANGRANKKIKEYGITNAQIIEASASQLPFEDKSIDMIVSNLGINNFEDTPTVFKECHRVLKEDGTLSLTTNLDGHWSAFIKYLKNVCSI